MIKIYKHKNVITMVFIARPKYGGLMKQLVF